MSFIDGYERQLVEAAERRRDARLSRRARRWVSGRRRGVAVALAALVVAVPAAAATVGGWDPFEGPGRSDQVGRPTASQRAVDPALASQLGVLRRAQTPADRAASTSARLRRVGRQYQGAQLDGVRVVDQERGAVLVPFDQMPVPRDAEGAPVPGFEQAADEPVVCVFEATADGLGGGGGCHSAGKIDRGAAIASDGGEVSGLVPDGVARVRLIRGDEASEAPVAENYFRTGDAPASPRFVEWLAADGSVIKRIDLNAARR